MILITNRQRKYKIDTQALSLMIQKMLDCIGYSDFDIAFLFTSELTMRRYNREFRHKDQPTDILSFPYHSGLKAGEKIVLYSDDDKNLGDIIISPIWVAKKAVAFDRTFDEHLCALIAHGIAHLLGYEHETEADLKKMESIEKKLLARI